MKYLKISLGIFAALAASRFFPHPPNFTSLIALGFYIPAIFGRKFIPVIILSFLVTDIYLGFHDTVFFTWGTIILIGLFAKIFANTFLVRIIGALISSCLFFIITNFGVWTLGSYGLTFNGLITCYIMAIPFFAYNLISTLFFSVIIESLLKLNLAKVVN